MAKKYGKKTVFANIIKGGTTKNGDKYGDFISVFKDIELKKDMTVQIQTPQQRLEELEMIAEKMQAKGSNTASIEEQIERARETVQKGRVRFILSHQEVTEA